MTISRIELSKNTCLLRKIGVHLRPEKLVN